MSADFEPLQTITPEHARQLHALFQGEWWTRGRTLAEVHRLLEHCDLFFAFVDKSSGQLAAFARVLTDFTFKAFIFDVIVAPPYRRQGLGRRLLQAICDEPRLRGVGHLELYARPPVTEFYKRLGFTDELGELRLMRRTRAESAPTDDGSPAKAE